MDDSTRVVSLLPSATEVCYALGVEPVGVSHECDHPPEARALPAVNRSRVANAGSSASVNEQVAEAESAGGAYEIDPEALRAADPDLVIAQGVCDVCAVSGSLAREAVETAGVDADVLTLHSHSLRGVLGEVEQVGEAVGRPEAAAEVVADLRRRIDAVEAAAAGVERRPRVAVLDWMEPTMVAGHWVPEMVELAGGRYGLADPGDRSTVREWETICEYDPEVLVAAPCGFELDRTVEHADELTTRTGWASLAAVESGRAHAMDGHGHVNRPGPRLVDTLEHLAGLIHPDRSDAPPGDVARPMATRKRA